MYDRQVHPDQTKTVKGQNSKILVTAGTIKGPLLCLVGGIEKQRIFHDIEKKKQSKKRRKKIRRKKIRTKIERKEKKTRKEKRELGRKSMHQ